MQDLIEQYIAAFPAAMQEDMAAIRRTIENAIPEADSKIAWGMPTYCVGTTNIIHFSGHKAFISLHVGIEAVKQFQEQLGDYVGTKSVLHIGLRQKVPHELIAELARYNCDQALEKQCQRPTG